MATVTKYTIYRDQRAGIGKYLQSCANYKNQKGSDITCKATFEELGFELSGTFLPNFESFGTLHVHY